MSDNFFYLTIHKAKQNPFLLKIIVLLSLWIFLFWGFPTLLKIHDGLSPYRLYHDMIGVDSLPSPFIYPLIIISFGFLLFNLIFKKEAQKKTDKGIKSSLFSFGLIASLLYWPFTPLHLGVLLSFITLSILPPTIKVTSKANSNSSYHWIIFSSIACYLLSLLSFFYFFPLENWGQYLLADDFPKYFYFSWYQANSLIDGFFGGWNPSFSGGYPSVLDLRFIGPFFIPFRLFGDLQGYHIMLFTFFAALPLSLFFLGKELHQKSKSFPWLCLFSSSILLPYLFKWILKWGLVPNYMAYVFFFFCLTFLEGMIRKKNFSLLGFLLCLSCVLHLHLLTFAFLIPIVILRARGNGKNNISYMEIFKSIILFILLNFPFFFHVLKNFSYIVPSFFYSSHPSKLYSIPSLPILPAIFIWSLNTVLFRYYFLSLVFFLPFLNSQSGHKIKTYLKSALFVFLFFAFTYPVIALEAKQTFPLFLSLGLAKWLHKVRSHKYTLISGMLLSLLTLFLFINSEDLSKKRLHQEECYPELVKLIKHSPGPVLFENIAQISPFKESQKEFSPSPFSHFEGYLFYQSAQEFLSHYGADPYPYFSYREGLIVEGTWNGDVLAKCPPVDLWTLYKKRNIHFIILHTDEGFQYFQKHSKYFKFFKEVEGFKVFQLVPPSHSPIDVEWLGPNSCQIQYSNLEPKPSLQLPINHHPNWKAYLEEKEIKIKNQEGLISISIPKEKFGTKVQLIWDSYPWLWLVSLLALVLIPKKNPLESTRGD